MSSKNKITLSIISIFAIIMCSVSAVVAIFAAKTRSFSSPGISVTYHCAEIDGKVSAKYYLGETDTAGTQLRQDGKSTGLTELVFESGMDSVSAELSPVEKNIGLTVEKTFVVFEYYFTNTSQQNNFEATLNFSGDAENVEVSITKSENKITNFDSIKSTVSNPKSFSIKTEINTGGGIGYVYVIARAINFADNSLFSGNFEWNLAIPEPATTEKLTFVNKSNHYSVKQKNSSVSGEIIIPDEYENLPVTEIEPTAFADNAKITSITMPSSITTIGSEAFRRCTGITEITVPENVTNLSNHVFSDCSSLIKVNYNATANESSCIGSQTFYGISSNAEIIVGDNVTKIPAGLFEETTCKTITLGSSVTSIGNSAFNECNATEITISKNVLNIGSKAFTNSSITTLNYNATAAEDLSAAGCFSGVSLNLKVGDNVVRIPSYLFSGATLLSMDLGAGLTSIGEGAFKSCSSILEINLPNNLTEIENDAFNGCGITILTLPESLKNLGERAFAGNNISRVNFNAIEMNDMAENHQCFNKLNGAVYIGNSVKRIPANIFASAGVSSVNLGTNVQIIGANAFSSCPFSAIEFPSSLEEIEDEAFASSNLTKLTIPATLNVLGSRVFANSSKLQTVNFNATAMKDLKSNSACFANVPMSVVLSNDVTRIPAYIFSESGLKSINLANVEIVGDGACKNCSNLAEVLPSNNLRIIGAEAFYNNKISSIVIPEGVKEIGDRAFANCSYLSQINYNAIAVKDSVIGGCFENAGTETATSGNKIIFSANVIRVPAYMFSNYKLLSNVEFGSSLNEIGAGAFKDCGGATADFTLPNSVTIIGDEAFSGWNFTSVKIQRNVSYLGNQAFANCPNLQNIEYSAIHVEDLIEDSSVFLNSGSDASSLSLVINGITEYIPANLFSYSNITDIKIDAAFLSSFGNSAFANCAKLSKVEFIKSAELEDSTENDKLFYNSGIDAEAFEVEFVHEITNVPAYMFYNSYITSVLIATPYDYITLGNYAFANCSKLKTVTLKDSTIFDLYPDSNCFYNSGADNKIEANVGLREVPAYLFYNTNLYKLNISDVSILGEYCFANCSILNSVEFGCNADFVYDNGNPIRMDDIVGQMYGGVTFSYFYKSGIEGFDLTTVSMPFIPAGFFDGTNIKQITISGDVPNGLFSDSLFCFCYKLRHVIYAANGYNTESDYAYNFNCSGIEFVDGNVESLPIDITIEENVLTEPCGIFYPFFLGSFTINADIYIEGEMFCWELYPIVYGKETTLTVGENVNSQLDGILYYPFSNIVVNPNNQTYTSRDKTGKECNVLIDKTTKTLIKGAGNAIINENLDITTISTNACNYTNSDIDEFNNIKEIRIGASVTSIGKNAFYNLGKLNSIYVNPSNSAYTSRDKSNKECNVLIERATYTIIQGCNSSILPQDDSVKIIGSNSFQYCENFTSVTITSYITLIESNAFYGCINIFEVVNKSQLDIVAGQTTHGYVAYYTTIVVTSDSQKGTVETTDGIKYYRKGSDLIAIGFVDAPLSVVKLKQGTTSINKNAFSHYSEIVEVNIPSSLKEIGEQAFYYCSNLKTISGEGLKNVRTIGTDAFSNCLNLTGELVFNAVETIGNSAFSSCSKISKITMANNTINSIGTYAFYSCSSLNTAILQWPSTISVGNKAFAYCRYLIEVADLSNIGLKPGSGDYGGSDYYYGGGGIAYYAKNVCTSLSGLGTFEVVDGVRYYRFSQGLIAMNLVNKNLTTLKLQQGTTEILPNTFQDCSQLTGNLVIPSSMSKIGEYAFSGCTGITGNLVIPSSEQVGREAFHSCGITNLEIDSKSIGQEAFGYCPNLTTIVLGDSVQSISAYAFWDNYKLTTVTLGANVKTISTQAFAFCYNLLEIVNKSSLTLTLGSDKYGYVAYYAKYITDAKSGSTEVINGVRYFRKGSDLWAIGLENKSITKLEFQNGTIGMASRAFYNETNITEVVFLDSIQKIEYSAFDGCTNLKNITFGTGVLTIGNYAFSGCNGLTTITIDQNVQTIGNNAFSSCKNLVEVIIGSNVQTIGDNAFAQCSNLKEINIPNNVTSLGSKAFSECSSLTNVILGSGLTNIYSGTFSKCSSLLTITIGSKLTISSGAFEYCYNLTEIYNKSTMTISGDLSTYSYRTIKSESDKGRFEIYENQIYYLYSTNVVLVGEVSGSANSSLNLRNDITEIKQYAFYGSSIRGQLKILDSVTKIGVNAFSNCTMIEKIYIGKGLTSMGSDAFSGMLKVKELNFNAVNCPNFTSSFSFGSLMGGYSETTKLKIIIGDDVQKIPSYFMANNQMYASINLTIGKSITSIGTLAFKGKPISSITFNAVNCANSTSTVQAFNSCTLYGIKVVIGDEVKTIPAYLFYAATAPKITSITIGAGVTTIGTYAFYNLSSLSEIKYNAVSCTNLTSSTKAFYYTSTSTSTTPIKVVFGEGVQTIPAYLFNNGSASYRPNITSVTISSTVTSIGDYAFRYCDTITEIIIDSQSVYNNISSTTSSNGYLIYYLKSTGQVKVNSSITGTNSYLSSTSFTAAGDEVINGTTYNVYTKK